MEGNYKHIHIILNLSPQTEWNLLELTEFISKLPKLYQKYGVRLKIEACREGEESFVFEAAATMPDAAAPDSDTSNLIYSNTAAKEELSTQTISMDLTDVRLYSSPASVLFALVFRLKEAGCDVPVEFGGENAFCVNVHGYNVITLPRHHLMLCDPYGSEHVRDYEDAIRQRQELRLLIRERALRPSNMFSSERVKRVKELLQRESSFIKVWEHSFLRLISFVEKLSAAGMLTETMRASLGKLADGNYEEALRMLEDGDYEEALRMFEDDASDSDRSLYRRTPDELLLRYYLIRTHVKEPGIWKKACLALEKAAGREEEQTSNKAAGREAKQTSNKAAASSGAALMQYLRWQITRQDYERAVTAADQCLQHPRLKTSVEVLFLKGMALSAMRRLSEADRTFDEAIRLCRERAKGKPLTVLPVLVLCMCEKAKTLVKAGQNPAAQNVLREAQDILVNKIPGQEIFGLVFSRQVESRDFIYDHTSLCAYIAAARLLEEKSRLLEQEEKYDEAAKLMKDSYNLAREAYCGYPDPAGVYIRADLMNTMGYIHWENDDIYHAGELLSDANGMITRLRALVPDAWPVLHADICNNRGIVLSDNMYKYTDAKQEYLRAVELLEKEAPGSLLATELLGDCYFDLGLLYSKWGKKNKAVDYLKDARRQYMAVGKKVMKEKLELLAEELNDLG